ncbi:hypothetical protein ERO13_D13G042100v2 [Gossypium hirsutum]|nr:hypothetical protein ERO13_D13G042100v2 [Gossypium hirsutum]
MGFNMKIFHCFFIFLLLPLLLLPSLALNNDGVLLLSFKYSILSDPLSVLQSWNYDEETPCQWYGVTCNEIGMVTSLVLPNSQLLGSISEDIGHIQHLHHLDLSSNFFNGTLPSSIFNSTELQVLSLGGNVISGELPETIAGMASLQILNLSDNALAGKIPQNLTLLQNLTVLLDLSSNLLNGTLPLDFGGGNLGLLNLSYNKISGSISPEFADKVPHNATIDLSFNNLTGAIPESLVNQKMDSFYGNFDLCGKPLKNPCSIPSTLSTPPNMSQSISPAIAVIPKPIDSTPGEPNNNVQTQARRSLNPGTIAAIAVADLAGLSIIAMVILYVYQLKKRNGLHTQSTTSNLEKKPDVNPVSTLMPSSCSSCMKIKLVETSETASSDSELEEKNQDFNVSPAEAYQKGGKLVIVNEGNEQLELETLLKASAYVLGTSGSSILYKAVLENGTAFAVRRVGDSSVARLKDFESQVRGIAKLKHPNLVKLVGFYWGNDEKLVIYDFVSNGSLGCSSYKKSTQSKDLLHSFLLSRLLCQEYVAHLRRKSSGFSRGASIYRGVTSQLLNMNLSGTLAPELGQLSHLKILHFMWNELTGNIPKEIGHISTLRLLKITGPIIILTLPFNS